jgi:hypothetical protein
LEGFADISPQEILYLMRDRHYFQRVIDLFYFHGRLDCEVNFRATHSTRRCNLEEREIALESVKNHLAFLEEPALEDTHFYREGFLILYDLDNSLGSRLNREEIHELFGKSRIESWGRESCPAAGMTGTGIPCVFGALRSLFSASMPNCHLLSKHHNKEAKALLPLFCPLHSRSRRSSRSFSLFGLFSLFSQLAARSSKRLFFSHVDIMKNFPFELSIKSC